MQPRNLSISDLKKLHKAVREKIDCAKDVPASKGYVPEKYTGCEHSDRYELVEWSEVQDLMGEEWFYKEAVLKDTADGSTAYFIPVIRL